MKETIRAAGVLPYSKDQRGRTWFLLGREKPNANWGVDSGSWSEFGGSVDSGETAEEGAAREFFEETMGAVFGRKEWMEHELKCGRYLVAMDSRTPSGKVYRSFVKYIPFVDYPTKFARYRTMSKKEPHLFAELSSDCFRDDARMHPSCTEKTAIAWFSAESIARAVEQYRNQPARDAEKLVAYNEPDGVPHVRTGFAIDFAHLLNTTWAKAGFTHDFLHFPRLPRWGGTPPDESSSSSEARPIIRTPRFTDPIRAATPQTPHVPSTGTRQAASGSSRKRENPPTMVVNMDGYSFHKKRRRKKRKEVYRPKPPVF